MAAISTKKGTFTTPSGTGTDAITGVGFTPKALILWGVPVTSESVAVHAAAWTGFTDGTNDKVIMVASENGVTDTRRDINQSACLSILNADNDTPVAVATLSSFDGDGFTLSYSSTTTGYVVHYIALGGADLTAEVGQTGASASPVTGLAFQPEFVFTMSAGLALGGAASQHAIHAGLGCFNATDEWWLATYQGQNDNANKDSILLTSGFTGQLFTGAMTWEASFSAFTSDGFSWTGSNADGFYYLALDLNGAGTDIGNFTKSTATAPASQDLPDLGFTPQIYGLATGSKTSQSVTADGCAASMGAYDGTTQGLTFRTDPNSATNADQRQNASNVLATGTSNAVFDALGTAQAITDATPTIIWDPNNAVADIIGYWAFESSVAFELTGVTRDDAGVILGSCEVFLFKHNEAGDARTQVDHVTSNASTGVYLFTGISDNDSDYVVMAFKDDTPHIFGITDRTLTPESNPASTDFDVCLRSDVEKGEVSVDNDLRLWDQTKVTGVSAPFFGANF